MSEEALPLFTESDAYRKLQVGYSY